MGLPNINIEFKTAGITAIGRSQKGTVALILRDDGENTAGAHILTGAAEIPKGLSQENREYVQRAFIGYVSPPRQVILYVLGEAAENLSEATKYLSTVQVDYVAGPESCTKEEAQELALWVKTSRQNDLIPKAVLPATPADSEGVVNFTATDIQAGEKTYTTAQYCSRIAGLIAGTPMTISCTYAPLPEVTDVKRLPKTELDAAVERGEFVLFHDGEKVKVGRGVNSLVSTNQDKGPAFQKLKLVEAVDMMRADIRKTAQDSYIGKFANSYDNKCLLITAVQGYFETLELEGILDKGKSQVGIDIPRQEAYLKSTGVDTTAMTLQKIKEANTAAQVFLAAGVKILDAIEDINLEITI